MTGAELDNMFQRSARKIVAVEIASAIAAEHPTAKNPHPTIVAVLDDGRRVELFSYAAHEQAFTAGDFVGLTVDEGRRLQFAKRAS
jgi:hypothetical protein